MLRSLTSAAAALARAVRAGRVLRLCVACFLALVAANAFAGVDQQFPEVHGYFPQATSFGEISGKPPAAPVYRGDEVIGYVFESAMVAPVPAYSGEPINVLVAIDTQGKILGTKVIYQNEPILLVGIPVERLYDFVARYVGHNVQEKLVVGGGGGSGSVNIDAISSATVTSMAANETIMNAALEVAVARRLVAGPLATTTAVAAIRTDYFRKADWQALTGNGAIRRLRLERGQVVAAFKDEPESGLVDDPTEPAPGHETETFIDLYYADVTPPTVGRNLLGEHAYAELMQGLKPGDEVFAVLANGLYSYKGVGYVRGGIFDRLHILQNGKLFLFKDRDYLALNTPELAGMPAFAETGLFVLRAGAGFNPGAPWTLQLLVNRQTGPLQRAYHTFSAGYQLPAEYLVRPSAASRLIPDDAPLWVKVWYARRFQILILVAGLLFLTLLLTFQDWVVKRPRLLARLRVGFLIYTVVFIGWYGLAQLSVVNVLTFLNAVIHGFHWSTFLMDPLQFILWTFVAACLVIVGRGVFCGWLCPFGALQELINKAAKKFRVRQWEPPRFLHERLWAIKYLILMVLFGMSLQSVSLAERIAEVEPFKTAIVLHFMRSWGFVLYAGIWLAAAVFTDKVYCRYLCPLGAGLAIGGRMHLFQWLRRRNECGHPCQICAEECEVRAIAPTGEINYNECHYCLDCQVTYWNDHKCPPLVAHRKLMEKYAARAAAAKGLPAGVILVSEAKKDAPVKAKA